MLFSELITFCLLLLKKKAEKYTIKKIIRGQARKSNISIFTYQLDDFPCSILSLIHKFRSLFITFEFQAPEI
jgi:hypothetical protein